MLRGTYPATNHPRPEPVLQRAILTRPMVGMAFAGMARIVSLLEKRMQSVVRSKQISRARVAIVAAATWPVFERSALLRRSCRANPLKRQAMERKLCHLPRLFRVARRVRPRRRSKAKDERTVSDSDSQYG